VEPEGSLPHSQVTATCLYPEPAQSSPYPHISYPSISSGPRVCVWTFSNKDTFSRWGVVSPSSKPQAGGPPLVGCPRLLIQYISSNPPFWRPFLHPQPQDAPCYGDRDPHITWWEVVTGTHLSHSEKIATHVLFSVTSLSPEERALYEVMCTNRLEPDRPQMAIKYDEKKLRFARRITKARIQTQTYLI
jgi:hypothetical protein